MNIDYLILGMLFIVCVLVLIEFYLVNKLVKKLISTQARVKKLEKKILEIVVGDVEDIKPNDEIVAK